MYAYLSNKQGFLLIFFSRFCPAPRKIFPLVYLFFHIFPPSLLILEINPQSLIYSLTLCFLIQELFLNPPRLFSPKGQIISKANYGTLNSSKKWTKKFNFTTMILVFVRFLEEIEGIKKTFWNQLTFNCLLKR